MHRRIMIKFGMRMHSETTKTAVSSKTEPEVEIDRQRSPFWISFSLNILAAEQNICTEFNTK